MFKPTAFGISPPVGENHLVTLQNLLYSLAHTSAVGSRGIRDHIPRRENLHLFGVIPLVGLLTPLGKLSLVVSVRDRNEYLLHFCLNKKKAPRVRRL